MLRLSSLSLQLLAADDAGEAADVLECLVGADDLLDVLGHEVVLRPALAVLAVGVDEQHLARALGGLGPWCAQHEDAGRDAGAVEEVRAEADDRLEDVLVEKPGADLASRRRRGTARRAA